MHATGLMTLLLLRIDELFIVTASRNSRGIKHAGLSLDATDTPWPRLARLQRRGTIL